MVKLESFIRRTTHKAILFADISGSSALYKTQGNAKAKEIVDSLLESVKKLVVDHQGSVIKTIGDEVMACFNECEKALTAAVAMQLRFSSVLQKNSLKLSVGIGYGEVLTDNGDLFGEAVNDSAHLTGLAKGGQILMTESVLAQLGAQAKTMVREYDKVKLKGAQTDSLIYRVYWQDGLSQASETRLMSSKFVRQEINVATLKIEYAGKTYYIDQNQTPFIIGRDANRCHLQVDASQVSREHCKIEFHRGKFVLVDHSTNGCYLSLPGQEEFYMRNEEYPLVVTVTVSLGISAAQANAESIVLSI